MRFDDDFFDGVFLGGREAELVEAQEDFSARQKTQRDAFAVNRRHGGDADVDFLALDADVDAAVLREALLGDIHPAHHLDARNERGLVTFQLRRHRGLMQNAVDAIPDAQFVFRRFKMNVRRAVLERFPDDLVDELDDARLLVVLGDFLVGGELQVHRIGLAHFIERFRADAVIFLQRLLDFHLGREGELHRHVRVELHRVHHRGVERIAHDDLQGAVFQRSRQDGILKGDLGGELVPRLGGDGQLGQVEIRPAERRREPLDENILGHAAFARHESQQRLHRAGVRRAAPRLPPVLKLDGRGFRDGRDQIFYRAKGHLLSLVQQHEP